MYMVCPHRHQWSKVCPEPTWEAPGPFHVQEASCWLVNIPGENENYPRHAWKSTPYIAVVCHKRGHGQNMLRRLFMELIDCLCEEQSFHFSIRIQQPIFAFYSSSSVSHSIRNAVNNKNNELFFNRNLGNQQSDCDRVVILVTSIEKDWSSWNKYH